MHPTLIRGGRVIDPATSTDATGDVLVAEGRIQAISIKGRASTPAGAEVVDAEGCIVCPGLIDPHVHLREPGGEHKETVRSGATAAVRGGFATVCCMPNTQPAIDSPVLVDFIRLKAQEAAMARVFCVAAATVGREGKHLAPIGAMAAAGAVGFSDDGDCIADAGVMGKALAMCRSAGRAFMQHAQEPSLTHGAVMHAGVVSARLGLGGWPAVAEEVIVERDIRLNRAIGCRYHVQHVSAGGTVEILRRARREGQPVSGEASPHHLLLTDEACIGYCTQAKVNPPLRTEADCAALREGVADGTIDILATDHAPHTAAEKARDFTAAPFGMVGLETALALYAKALIESGVIAWPRLIELLTLGPARLCGLDAMGLGRLEVGGPADVTLIDPDEKWTVDPSAFASQSQNTPFAGWALKGRARGVWVAGVRRLGGRA